MLLAPRSTGLELSIPLRSLRDFHDLAAQTSDFFEPPTIAAMAAAAVSRGAVEPLTNLSIPRDELTHVENLREGLVFEGVNSRCRAVMLCIEDATRDVFNPAIYAAEANSPFALRLRGKFPRFIGSEYAPGREAELYPVACEDIQDLSFPDAVFDIVSTNEVLEHIPSIDAALHEIYRILKPGGWHIGTVPFEFGQMESVIKARMKGDKVIHLMEPEYHGDPLSELGALVFEIPGWNILDRARSVGFAEAHFQFVFSAIHAIMDSHVGGIFVLCLQKGLSEERYGGARSNGGA